MRKNFWLITLAAVLMLTVAAIPAISEKAPDAPALTTSAETTKEPAAVFPSAAAVIRAGTVTVQGTASINLKADYASVNLGVNTKGATVAEAQKANSEIMDKVIAAIKKQGVAEEDIVTNSFNVYPNYDYQYSKLTEGDSVAGYQVENMLMVTVRDMGVLSGVLDAAMSAGANQSYGITFNSSKQAVTYDEALKDAIADGARKAGLMAEASGKTLGGLLSMEENQYSYNLYGASAKTMDAQAAAGTPILAGQITVTATVTLVYNFE